MMRFSVATLALVSADMPTWEEWKWENEVAYNGDDEDAHRKGIFDTNVQMINEHNAKGLSWTMGMNHFGDRTHGEFVAIVSSNKTNTDPPHGALFHEDFSSSSPSSKDWVAEGIFNPIRHQQNSDCWAHSAIGVLESNWKLHSGTLPMLSEQQLCDCSKSGTCKGGGDEDGALEWFENHKACSRATYKYTGHDASCKESSCTAAIPKGAVHSTTYVDASASKLKSALASRPVTASVYAAGLSQFYNGGVVDSGCGGSVNHAVIAVGYGSSNGEQYFKIRNSWGKSWGEHGYIRLGASSSSKHGNACLFRWPGSYPKFGGSPSPSPSPSRRRRRRSSPSPSPSPSPSYYSYYYYNGNGEKFKGMGKHSKVFRNGMAGKMGRKAMGRMGKSVVV